MSGKLTRAGSGAEEPTSGEPSISGTRPRSELQNLAELHPEELFDKQERGELSETEQKTLALHLERCQACRSERAARSYFRAELGLDVGSLEFALGGALGRIAELGPAPSDPEPPAPALGRESPQSPAAQLKAAGLPPAGLPAAGLPPAGLPGPHLLTDERAETELSLLAPPSPSRAPLARARARRLRGALLVSSVLLAGAAAAWVGASGRPKSEPASTPRSSAVGSLGQYSPLPAAVTAAASSTTQRPEPQADQPVPQPAATEPPTPNGGVRVKLSKPAALPTPPSLSPRAQPGSAGTAGAAGTGAESSTDPQSAGELFAAGNLARSGKQFARAKGHYVELVERFPDSAEARTARALLAQLALDTGDTAEALAAFDSYLAEPGAAALTEDALIGRARALHKLGRLTEERATWRRLLRDFPESAASAEAKRRLTTAQ